MTVTCHAPAAAPDLTPLALASAIVDDEATEIDDEDDVDREYSYDELSDTAKDRAREWFITSDYDYFDCDALEDSLRESIELSGFDVKDVYFSLNYCQGDGVAFEGQLNIREFLTPSVPDYVPSPDSKERPRWTRHTDSDFTALRSFLRKYERFEEALTVRIATDNYGGSRIHGMSTDVYLDDSEPAEGHEYTARETILFKQLESSLNELEDLVTAVWRTIVGWLQRDGYDEIEYQHSDEVVEEAMDQYDFTFDVEGRRAD